jgi:hypothetical protein
MVGVSIGNASRRVPRDDKIALSDQPLAPSRGRRFYLAIRRSVLLCLCAPCQMYTTPRYRAKHVQIDHCGLRSGDRRTTRPSSCDGGVIGRAVIALDSCSRSVSGLLDLVPSTCVVLAGNRALDQAWNGRRPHLIAREKCADRKWELRSADRRTNRPSSCNGRVIGLRSLRWTPAADLRLDGLILCRRPAAAPDRSGEMRDWKWELRSADRRTNRPSSCTLVSPDVHSLRCTPAADLRLGCLISCRRPASCLPETVHSTKLGIGRRQRLIAR